MNFLTILKPLAKILYQKGFPTIYQAYAIYIIIVPYPLSVGSSVTKLMWISSQGNCGMGNCWYNPASFQVPTLNK